MPQPWLTVIGIGDGGLGTLSPEQRRALDMAECVFGGARHLAMLDAGARELVPWRSPFSEAINDLAARRGRRVAALASGDPTWFGLAGTLFRSIDPAEMRVLPGVSSFSLAAARLGWPLETCETLSVHGRPIEGIDLRLVPGARLLVYARDGDSPREIARRLTGRGYGPSRLVVLEHLGGAEERVIETTASGFDLDRSADLVTVAVECVAGRGAIPRPFVPGLPDDAFVHDGKLTKRVGRALALAALQPMPGALLWDVGSGCGSVAVEWARAAKDTVAIAIESREDRLRMIAENADALGAAASIEIVEGRAPDALAGLLRPDAVFVGGGLSDGVLDPCWTALLPGGRLVAHAVTLESEAILLDAYARLGGELTRLHVEHAAPVGPFHGWKPSMPVLHWAATKPSEG
ncbi:precorrin-6y C5,15-methyltransferase (decarboxylating) subunit CbiE [Aureimonas leprariae]|uniref:Precorrin-6y C5,15-methyltransferase (Decarboxylating) subunit CbiE n=1 Tax=Plantimonas leprariae TaxID=2615207 RepID=A0A7V7PNZ2_9HYPH|nr:precorrin-6y C5,15-methyltransferase (decarboxylating) subunit CbiE [Aureimonas leprariae]KAB0679644.1 precorrin-6y C5,15-methyltransferase (decarboxylating) subunit CbiE [Aureimonas leprariae]